MGDFTPEMPDPASKWQQINIVDAAGLVKKSGIQTKYSVF
jgi:hypothetical protein